MSLHKLTAGDGYTYLTRQVAAHDATHRGYPSLGAYYAQRGEAPGVWMGRGLVGLPGVADGPVTEAQMLALFGQGRHPNAAQIEALRADMGLSAATLLGTPFPIVQGVTEYHRRVAAAMAAVNAASGFPADWPVPAADRARLRTHVADAMFLEEYGRAPADPRERSGFLARVSRQATTAVAGYDLTFSPVKSVSAVWALAPGETSRRIEAAHHAAVADTLAWLEDHAVYTRRGINGVAQVDVTGVIAAAFTHRDSRSGDPDLHTHVAVSNKVQALDGRWLALDGRPLHGYAVAASERYNTRLEAHLVAAFPAVVFADRAAVAGESGRRPVREIVGVDARLLAEWSSRREAIEVRRGVLSAGFHADHGRPPTVVEAIHLAQQATLETRPAKHQPRSHAEQRTTWAAEAAVVLGGSGQVTAMITAALDPTSRQRPARLERGVSAPWVDRVAADVLTVMEATRATWRESHVRAEAERRARTDAVPLHLLDEAVDAVVAAALSPARSVRLGPDDPVSVTMGEPGVLRRRDGTSVYETAGTRQYTSATVLDAEHRILTAAARTDGRAANPRIVDLAVLEHAAGGTPLTPGQAQLVHDLVTSGRRVQVALAPAGTGKTTALAVLARAWADAGGNLIGLAPSAAAAAVLRDELGAPTDTIAKLLHTLVHSPGRDETAGGPGSRAQLGPETLVVIDEAGMASTPDLATVVDHVLAAGGSVRLVGDDQQLAAIGAGGILRDLAVTYGATTLTQVVRFTDSAEGAASLQIRNGNPAAIAYYTDHARIHVGDLATVTDHAYSAWAADTAAGQDAVLLAPTRDLVATLNSRAQSDRSSVDHSPEPGVRLGDGSRAHPGDTVITLVNRRRLVVTATDWVKNGDRWTVTAVTPDGSLQVVHRRTGRRVVLPAGYVAEHVALGYATTVHSAQGVTADVAHTVAGGTETRQIAYVALTRGRHANHLYLATVGDGDPHAVTTRDALLPPTAVDVLTRILDRDGAQTSATTTAAALSDPVRLLAGAADRYDHALATAAEDVLGPDGLATFAAAADTRVPGITAHGGWTTLRSHLALLAAAGCDPIAELDQALSGRGLSDAVDPAAVLDWRLDPTRQRPAAQGIGVDDGRSGPVAAPLPWLPAVPRPLAAHPTWGPYLTARAAHTRDLAARVAAATRSWTPTTAPGWAVPLLDHDQRAGDRQQDEDGGSLPARVAVWRAAHAFPDTDPRPTGAPVPHAAHARHQRILAAALTAALGDPGTATARWAASVTAVDLRIIDDAYWPTLAASLDAAARAGIDVPAVLAAADPDRPLPDEQPAAALWWRLTRHLPPTLDDHGPAGGRHPAVAPALVDPDNVDDVDLDEAAYVAAARADSLAFWAAVETRTTRPSPTPPTPDTGVSVQRILDLNAAAASYYAARYPESWAADHVRGRFGTDLTDPAFTGHGFTPGYAPPGWRALTDHLRGIGATDLEIVTAGLGTYAVGTTRVLDRFRDRLVLPIRTSEGIVGFVARRRPDGADTDGPKYLNTADTAAYRKGAVLYGAADVADLLAAGAAPVIVEGPLDAIAVTLAGRGDFVGVAPLGTSLTPAQVTRLRPWLGDEGTRVIVGADNDSAGRRAAHRAYELLTARGADPRHLCLPDGADPADHYRIAGPTALYTALTEAPGLAASLLDEILTAHADRLDSIGGRVQALRAAAAVIGAAPPRTWPAHIATLQTRLDLLPQTIQREVLDAGLGGTRSGEREDRPAGLGGRPPYPGSTPAPAIHQAAAGHTRARGPAPRR